MDDIYITCRVTSDRGRGLLPLAQNFRMQARPDRPCRFPKSQAGRAAQQHWCNHIDKICTKGRLAVPACPSALSCQKLSLVVSVVPIISFKGPCTISWVLSELIVS